MKSNEFQPFSQDKKYGKNIDMNYDLKKYTRFVLIEYKNKDLYGKAKSFSQITIQTTSGFATTKL